MKIKTVLVANRKLTRLGGSETFTFSFIKELVKQGYKVEYFTFKKGLVAKKIEEELNVKFMSKNKYDIVFANHKKCVQHLSYKGIIIQTCHGIFPKSEQPASLADAYIGISDEVKTYLNNKGLECATILNGIDCNKYSPKKIINQKLTNVLSLCQSEEANSELKKACDKLNLNFYNLNKNINPIWEISSTINEYDLVVGLGRSAYEAMACGRPVLVYDNRSYAKSYADGYLSEEIIEKAILNNCSGRFFKHSFSVNDLVNELKKYKPEDGKFVRDYALQNLNIKHQVNKYITIAQQTTRNESLKRNLKKWSYNLKLQLMLTFNI